MPVLRAVRVITRLETQLFQAGVLTLFRIYRREMKREIERRIGHEPKLIELSVYYQNPEVMEFWTIWTS